MPYYESKVHRDQSNTTFGRAFKGPQMAGFVPFLAFLIEPVQDLCKTNLRSKPIGAYYLHGWTKLQLLKKSQVADG